MSEILTVNKICPVRPPSGFTQYPASLPNNSPGEFAQYLVKLIRVCTSNNSTLVCSTGQIDYSTYMDVQQDSKGLAQGLHCILTTK